MTADELLGKLQPLGTEGYKRVMLNHGVREPFFGVKISDLKVFVKEIKVDYQLALDLYATGNYDAMYLAGLIADDKRMTPADLNKWAKEAYCRGLSTSTVPWVAAGSLHGWELGLEWIRSKEPHIAVCGWATLSCIIAMRPDTDLDLDTVEELLQELRGNLHQAPDSVRYQMNSFVISVGSYVVPLHTLAVTVAQDIGKVSVDMGDTSCKVPFAPDDIEKVKSKGYLGKKRKMVKC